MGTQARPHIVVLGGGFGGLEAAYYTRMRLGGRAAITIISDHDYFQFKPNTIYIPFGLDPATLNVDIVEPARRKGITFVHDTIMAIDPITRIVETRRRTISYDFLVVATGAGMRRGEVSGLGQYAETIWTVQDMLRLRAAIANVIERARQGQRREILFLVPPHNKCSGPLYEVVQMLDTWLRRHGVRGQVGITWTTYEHGFIQAFGPRLHTAVTEEFARRGIVGYTDYVVDSVERDRVHFHGGQTLPYDLLISFPPYVAAMPFPQLPGDDRGFILTEQATRQVVGLPGVYAVGDAADFPVKQAFLAFLQADVAAEQIAAAVLDEEPAMHFEPMSMCVMEQFDTATFAQVPLRYTGDAEHPIEVVPGDAYRVGSSPIWRLGKKMLGIYLPWRFGAGNPFHAGLPWRGMEAGLKLMSGVLAS